MTTPALPKNRMDLIYKLEGSAIDEGVDVFRLSPLLLSIGQLIQESQQIAHPEGHELSVNIKPFEKGSFVMELSVFAQDNFHQLLEFINSDGVKEIKELLEWIGIIGGVTGVSAGGVIGIYKFLKGQPKRHEETEKGDIKIFSKDGNSMTVNKKTFALFQNNNIQQSIYNIYGDFLGHSGIEKVSSYIKSEPKTKTEVIKEDVAYFNPANAIFGETAENVKKNITTVFLNPKRGSWEGEPDNWSFRKGAGEIVKATIKDREFLNKIKSGEIRLAQGDLLEVTLVEIQVVEKDGQVNSKNEIINVLNYKKAPIQRSLLTPDEKT